MYKTIARGVWATDAATNRIETGEYKNRTMSNKLYTDETPAEVKNAKASPHPPRSRRSLAQQGADRVVLHARACTSSP